MFTTCRRNKSIQLADTLALGAVVYGDKLPSQKNGFATTTQNHLNISDVGCYHYKMPGRTSLQVNQYGCRTVLQTSRLQFPVNVCFTQYKNTQPCPSHYTARPRIQDGASCGLLAYTPASANTHCIYHAKLTWMAGYISQ